MDLTLTIRYLDDLAALGVALPAKTEAARDTYLEALRAASLNPSDGLQAALRAGEVTPNNVAELVRTASLEHAAQAHAHTIVRDLGLTFNRTINDGLREDFARIHTELKAAFSSAAETVAKAAEHFGPETNAEDVITGKPEAIKLWNRVDAATLTLEAVSSAYRRLLSDITRELPDEIVSLFVSGAVDLHQAGELYRERGRWLALARAGFTLTLNTPTEAASVAAAGEQVLADQAEAERQVAIKANQWRHRFEPALRGGK